MKYKTIATKKQFKFSKDVNNYADFKKELLIKVIHEMGVTTLYKMLENLRKEGNLNSTQKRYAKEDIKKLISANSCLVELDLNVELMTRMNFLYQNLDKDEFVHLKNQIIRKDIDPKPKNHLQRKVFT